MLLRQLFDTDTSSYTYLLADQGEALLIDPVYSQLAQYRQLIQELTLTLVAAIDTHIHADHITALSALRKETGCQTYLGNPGQVACADNGLHHAMTIPFGGQRLLALHTPGHTDDSYSFYLEVKSAEASSEKHREESDECRNEHNENPRYVFSGDCLLIRGTGRTDFQQGDAGQLYESLHQRLLTLPDDTVVLPGHDYRGWSQSTIGEERQHNPRLQILNRQAFIEHMGNLQLAKPRYMAVSVPANQRCGEPLSQQVSVQQVGVEEAK